MGSFIIYIKTTKVFLPTCITYSTKRHTCLWSEASTKSHKGLEETIQLELLTIPNLYNKPYRMNPKFYAN